MYRFIAIALLCLTASAATAREADTTTRIATRKVCSDAQRQQIRKHLLDGHSLDEVRQAYPCFNQEIAGLALDPDLRSLRGTHHGTSARQ